MTGNIRGKVVNKIDKEKNTDVTDLYDCDLGDYGGKHAGLLDSGGNGRK